MGLPGSTNLFTEALLLSYHAVPAVPRKWNSGYVQAVIDRSNKRIEVLDDRLAGVTQGRVMPDAEQITIGSGRRFDRLAVLFLDICSFSSRGNWTAEDQKQDNNNESLSANIMFECMVFAACGGLRRVAGRRGLFG